jgi:hypothetical protein
MLLVDDQALPVPTAARSSVPVAAPSPPMRDIDVDISLVAHAGRRPEPVTHGAKEMLHGPTAMRSLAPSTRYSRRPLRRVNVAHPACGRFPRRCGLLQRAPR